MERSTIDLSQSVSLVSRRFHRQGKEWAVAGIRVAVTNNALIQVFTLPSTWVTANAYMNGYRSWQRIQREALSTARFADTARYRDFKVYMDDNHSPSGGGADPAPNIVPLGTIQPDNNPGTSATEWKYSEIHVPAQGDGSTGELPYYMHMMGNTVAAVEGVSYGSAGLIHEYGLARLRPHLEDPALPDNHNLSIFTELFNDGDNLDQTLDDATEDNATPPYFIGEDNNAPEYYPGGANYLPTVQRWQIAKQAVYSSGTNTGVTATGNGFIPGFTCPLGLIRLYVENLANVGNTVDMFVDLVPGPSGGYMTRPMKEMN